ncbi:galactose-1-phosphate uridylyltransferase [Patescibacteria group bacterium]|nr:galactose-1-phosphate uridylyltransferase [Patescibacteria group bacterium]MBU1922466.1 galactose-1-phosphate uridylyltransferase [Patescibacteria group bacterium]
MHPEIRKDYIQEKYVIIAPKRDKRPHDVERPERARSAKEKSCVFCPKNINKEPALFNLGTAKNWRIKVILNKFPAVSLDNPKAYGWQEVVIEAPEHKPEIENLSDGRVAEILEVYAKRTEAISKNKNIEYILIFKNNGGRAGASLQHSHSQIFATKFLPPHLFDKSQKVQQYKLKHGTCVYCDVIKKESRGPRLIFRGKKIIAFAPYASMHNYEVWILPRRHVDNITLLTDEERKEWAQVLKKLLKQITRLGLPYNYYFHQVVFDEDQHLYMKIVPRGSVWAGVEIGSGLIINPVAPEDAAQYYRRAFGGK